MLHLIIFHDISTNFTITSWGQMSGAEFYEGDDLEEVTHNKLVADGYIEISKGEFTEIVEKMRNDPTPVVYPKGPAIHELFPETGEREIYREMRTTDENGKITWEKEMIYRGKEKRVYRYLPKTDELELVTDMNSLLNNVVK